MYKDNLLTQELLRENLLRDNLILLALVFVAGAIFFFLMQTIINLLSRPNTTEEQHGTKTNTTQNIEKQGFTSTKTVQNTEESSTRRNNDIQNSEELSFRSSSDIQNIADPNLMDTSVIQNMVNNYRNNQLPNINKNLKIEDSVSVWFDFNTVQNFISTVEKESKSRNENISLNDLGVRFYYAAYPKEENWDIFQNETMEPPKEYAQRHTLIMIPTLNIKDASGNYLNYDFNPLDENTYTRDSVARETFALHSKNTVAQNHGSLIPPTSSNVQDY